MASKFCLRSTILSVTKKITIMKKMILFLVFAGLLIGNASYAQRIVFVDTDYILNKIPAYKEAQQQIDNLTKEWQLEIQKEFEALEHMYKQYQVDKVLLSNDMRARREQEILDKEREVKELQRRRFGPDGDRFKKEEELIRPIQEEVYNGIKSLAEAQNYGFVLDAASSTLAIIHADKRHDVSDEVLKRLGYIK